MADNPEVRSMFRAYLRSWEAAHERWRRKCQGASLRKRTLQATGGLVSDARDTVRGVRTANPPVADARAPGPAGLSTVAEKQLRELEDTTRNCDRVIAYIGRVLVKLRFAVATGEWASNTMATQIKKAPKWISGSVDSVTRGQRMAVLKVEGDWWYVRKQVGKEGWVNRKEVEERLPAELSMAPVSGTKEVQGKEWWRNMTDAARN